MISTLKDFKAAITALTLKNSQIGLDAADKLVYILLPSGNQAVKLEDLCTDLRHELDSLGLRCTPAAAAAVAADSLQALCKNGFAERASRGLYRRTQDRSYI